MNIDDLISELIYYRDTNFITEVVCDEYSGWSKDMSLSTNTAHRLDEAFIDHWEMCHCDSPYHYDEDELVQCSSYKCVFCQHDIVPELILEWSY